MTEQNGNINANQLLGIQSAVVGDVNKTLSTMDVLSSLKAMDYFQKGGDIDPTIKRIADNELAYLKASMVAISSNPVLQTKFGNGLEGSMAVAGLLKQRNAQRQYEEILDGYATTVDNIPLQALNRVRAVDFGERDN